MSEYIASTGKQYRSHAATIKIRARQDREKAWPKKPTYSRKMYTFMEEYRKSEQEMERSIRLKMEKCAVFVAGMIEKYGREVMMPGLLAA